MLYFSIYFLNLSYLLFNFDYYFKNLCIRFNLFVIYIIALINHHLFPHFIYCNTYIHYFQKNIYFHFRIITNYLIFIFFIIFSYQIYFYFVDFLIFRLLLNFYKIKENFNLEIFIKNFIRFLNLNLFDLPCLF